MNSIGKCVLAIVITLLLANGLYAGSGYFIQQGGSDGLVSIEAENFAENQAGEENTWELTTEKQGFSDKGALAALPDKGNNEDIDYGDSPNTDYKVNFISTGKHYVWVRGYGVDSGNSIHIDLDHKELKSAQEIDLETDRWDWNSEADDGPAYLDIKTPGVHIVSLCMREDGAIVDKIILTTNPSYKPEGLGPVQSTKGGIIAFGAKESSNPETVGKISIPVILSTSEVGATYTVDYSIVDVTTTPEDYRTKGKKLVFKPGETEKKIDIQIAQDGIDEDAETFKVVLSNMTGPEAMLSDSSYTYTITDPRPFVSFVASSTGVAEGESTVDITLELTGSYYKAVSVNYSAGATQGKVLFKPGQTQQSFKVAVPNGTKGAIPVSISNPLNAKLGEKTTHKIVVCNRTYNSIDGAYYIRYRSGERWEKFEKVGEHADAVINLGPGDDRMIFWRGSSYLPFLDTVDGKSFVDVLVPQKNADGSGRMFDKTNKHSHIRIVEESPARVIVEWRYYPDMKQLNSWNWTEEYYSIYPDGTCYRSVKTGTETLAEYEDPDHVFVQPLLLTKEGVCPMPQSWTKPVELAIDGSCLNSFDDLGYDKVKGHYALASKVSGVASKLSFKVGADTVNPAILVKGWGDAGVKVSINGKAFAGFKTGYDKKMDNDDLVLWLGKEFKAGSEVVIEPVGGSAPVVRRPVPDPYKMKVPPFPASSEDPGKFGAFYTTLKYWKEWDKLRRVGDYADVVVQFDDSIDRLIFWRGTTNVPHWANDKNNWYENEFIERRAGDAGLPSGCAEPMQDHDSRFSRVKIIQSNPARVIVHWRYSPVVLSGQIPFVDETGWGDWIDEYYYVYPDETCVRDAKLFTSAPNVFNEWHEAIPTMGPGQMPEDCLDMKALMVANESGESLTFDFEKGFPDNSKFKDGYNIILIGMKGEKKPFAICERYGEWHDPISRPGDTRFNHYDDWPAWPPQYRRGDWDRKPENLNYRDFCEFLPAHSSLMHLDWDNYEDNYDGPVIWLRKVLLNGLTPNQDVTSLIPLSKYWEDAPVIKVTGYGYDGGYFEKSQKAYHIRRRVRTIGFEKMVNRDDDKHPNSDAEKAQIEILASEDSPLINPCFVIDGWPEGGVKVKLYINGKEIPEGKDFKQGIEENWDQSQWDSKHSLVVWTRCTSTEPIKFTIEQVKK